MTVLNPGSARFGSAKSNFPQEDINANSAPPIISGSSAADDSEATRAAADARLKQDSIARHAPGARIPVPAESTLGRWLEALKQVINSTAFKRLEEIFGGRGSFSHIDPNKGEIWLDGGRVKITRDSAELDSIPGGKELFDNVMTIGKKMTPYGILSRHDVFKSDASGANTVDSNVVQQFLYGPGPGALPDHHVPADILRKTGEADTRHNLLGALKKQIETPGVKPDLESITVEIAPHSVLWSAAQTQPVTMNLKQLLAAYGLQVPTTSQALANLELTLFTPPLSAPAQANYGGLLSKAVPLGEEEQKKINETVSAWKVQQTQVRVDSSGRTQSLFNYLARALSESQRALAETDPQAFLNALINTPQARALGKQLQEAIGALPTPSSGQEALLAALGLEADPAGGQERNNLAGYNLRQRDNVGRTPADIVERFQDHMEGRVGRDMAKAGAYQLLAMSAPEFLAKDVPPNLVYGSQQWAAFSAAVSRREQDTPGSTAGKTYAEIMQHDALEPVTEAGHHQVQLAAMTSVIDWGIANGVIEESKDGNYSPETIERVFAAMQAQAERLISTVESLAATMPTRKDVALAELKRVYGEEKAHLFEKKVFRRSGQPSRDDSRYSLLDIYMSGELRSYHWDSNSHEAYIGAFASGFSKLESAQKKFDEAFDQYTDNLSKAAGVNFQYQLSQLPAEERERFERGSVVVHHLNASSFSPFPEGSDEHPVFKLFGVGAVLFETHHEGKVVKYVFSPTLGKIIKAGEPFPGAPEGWNINVSVRRRKDGGGYRRTRYGLTVGDKFYELKENHQTAKSLEALPESHSALGTKELSARSEELAKGVTSMYSNAVNEFRKSARGVTEREKVEAQRKFLTNFLLGLVPFHNFIKSIVEGNKHDAVVYGLLDFLGLIVPGFKGGYAGAKIGAKGLGSALGFIKGFAKAGLKAANPFGSIYDAGKGVFKLGKTVVKSLPSVKFSLFDKARNLSGRSGSWNIPQGGYKQTIADGTYRRLGGDGAPVSVLATQQNGKWYALDPKTMSPYGTALKGFTPTNVQDLRDLRQGTAVSIKDGSSFKESQQEHQDIQARPGTAPTPSSQVEEQNRKAVEQSRDTTRLVKNAQS
ncbi:MULTISPECIES: hypothetical protein [Pseudomonas]|uniref:Uncharacterized protein n=1 Tax=Pseudomonas azadiae TaxID=2843612 RepID=A0ABS6NXD0_9PSED|nr:MULTISPECIES: hypothetical protein [Pseudomonas]MBV4452868.1 hypothetical protein [Pseudomonas azadiae]